MFSIIICSHRPERAEIARKHFSAVFSGHPHEIILIPDAHSLCEGYTRGLGQAQGDILIFSHDDIELITPDTPQRLKAHLEHLDLIGIAGTTRLIDGAWVSAGDPYCFALIIYPLSGDMLEAKCVGAGPQCVSGAQAQDGCFLCCRREVADTVGFDSGTFDGFHLYDLDFSFRAHLAGYRLGICRDIALIHDSRGKPDEIWAGYRERFEAKFWQQLAPGARGHVRMVRAHVSRQNIASFCQPENLAKMLAQLGKADET